MNEKESRMSTSEEYQRFLALIDEMAAKEDAEIEKSRKESKTDDFIFEDDIFAPYDPEDDYAEYEKINTDFNPDIEFDFFNNF